MLNIERTAAVLTHRFAESLRPYDITPTQYNVLRILRGAGSGGLCRHHIRDRLVSQVPDVTRLLYRLEKAGLIARQRSDRDRRLVTTRITRSGLALLRRLDEPVVKVQERQIGHLTRPQLRTLIDLLSAVRQGCPESE